MRIQIKLLILLSSVTLMTACATTAHFEAGLNAWVGKSESELIGSLGQPTQVLSLPNGDHALVYTTNRILRSGGYSTQSHSYNNDWGKKHSQGWNSTSTSTQQNVPLTDSLYSCSARYIIHQSVVASTGHTGNDCKAVDPSMEVLHQFVGQRAG